MYNLNVNTQDFIRDKKPIALLVSSYQPNENASDLLRVALDSMLRFKRKDSSIWVIDVGSPQSKFFVTPDEYPNINFIISDYTPRSWESTNLYKRLIKTFVGKKAPRSGSYANAWTLDLGLNTFKKINFNPEYFMTLQMDIMFTHYNCLDALLDLFEKDTIAVGVLKQKNLSKKHDILHSLGCLWRYDLILKNNFIFKNKLPKYDVAEFAIKSAIDKGYNIKSLRNSYNDFDVLKIIKKQFLEIGQGVDRAIDDDGNVVFMHLGRGILKSAGNYYKSDRATSKKWLDWYKLNISNI